MQNQVLGEQINLVGTSSFLRYNSVRQKDRTSSRSLNITLSQATIPASLKRIDLTVTVAGQIFQQSFPAQANQTFTFTWDGNDAYGRPVQGRQLAVVTVGYVYDGVYDATNRFGYNGNGTLIIGDRTRREVTLPVTYRVYVGTFDAQALGLGGWTLSQHHFYDPVEHVLYQGDGQIHTAQSINSIITTAAGNGAAGFSGDGGPATQATFGIASPQGVGVGSDGSVYIADTGNRVIRRIDPSGIITTVAGTPDVLCNPTTGVCGDGGPATSATLNSPVSVAVGPDGSLYIDDPGQGGGRVRKVSPNGIITTVAGTGQTCSDPTGGCGDGGPATQAQLSSNQHLAIAPDGTLYIADGNNHRVRRVGTDGIITTVAGSGNLPSPGCSNNGVLATAACLKFPFGVVAMPDGSFYFSDGQLNQLFRVGTDGIIAVVAGDGNCGSNGDGGPAVNARLCSPEQITRGPDNAIYVADWGNHEIRRIGPDGIITTVAGTGIAGFSGDDGPATQGQIRFPIGIAFGLDGGFYIADGNNRRLRRVQPTLPGFTATDIAVPSTDGSELYQFNAEGRHLRTINTFTGATIFTFTYDSGGRLTQITDGDNNITTIQRDAAGNPTGILSPYNQLTTFGLDANGYLASVTDPAGEAYQFTYTAGGLLTAETDPRTNQNTFTYDSGGRLTKDTDPATGFQTLARTDSGQSFTVTRNTALNRTSTFQVQNLTTGDRQRVNTDAAGLQTTLLERANGVNTSTDPDGTVTNETLGPDPRWKMQAPLPTKTIISTPGGLNLNTTFARVVALSNPSDPLSLTSQTDTTSINGNIYTTVFTAATKTFTTTTPLNRQATTVIDGQGRVTQSQFANLIQANYTYDSRGRLSATTFGSGTQSRNFSNSYNTAGLLASFTNPLTQVTSFTYDLAGRVTQQTLADNSVISFGYDANGNTTSITPPGRPAHLFTFTPVNLLASYTPPAVTGTGPTQFTYNLDRQITGITRPDSLALAFAYDTAGRLSTLTVPNGQYTYSYSATTGNLTGITAPGGGTVSLTYDGRLPIGTAWGGSVVGSVTRTFDNFFRIASQSINGGNTVNFAYDTDGLLTGAGNLALNRDAQNGLITGTTLGNVTDTRGYNNFAELTSYSASFNATSLYSTTYTRDKLGRIAEKVEAIGGVTDTFDYTYDAAGRLTQVSKNGTTISAYTYDSNSNRASLTTSGGTVNGTYDNQDRLTAYSNTTYAYSANGELQSKTVGGQTTQYSYDVVGNLRNVTLPAGTTIDYVIDGQNRRIGRKLNGVLVQGFLYQNALNPVAELDGSNNVVSVFVYGSRSNAPDYMIKNGTTYRLITDALGSVRLVVDVAAGTVAERLDYDEFGVVTMDTNPGFQPFGFAGGLYDPMTGLVRFGARDYDAAAGRWTAKDLILFGGRNPNLYEYAFSDPVNLTDPDGQGPEGGSVNPPMLSPDEIKNLSKDIAQDLLNKLIQAEEGLKKKLDDLKKGEQNSKKLCEQNDIQKKLDDIQKEIQLTNQRLADLENGAKQSQAQQDTKQQQAQDANNLLNILRALGLIK